MVDQKKESPPKGEFIDLDKSDFKKKTSFFQITLKCLILQLAIITFARNKVQTIYSKLTVSI